MQLIKRKCVDCDHVGLIAYCPACRGRAGGLRQTPAQQKSMKKAQKTAWALRRRKG